MFARSFARGLSLSVLAAILGVSATGGAAIKLGDNDTSGGGGTNSGGTTTCSTPVLSDCQNPAYRTSTCGAQKASVCNALITTDFKSRLASVSEQTDALLPSSLEGSGTLQTVKVVRDAAPVLKKYSATSLTLRNKLGLTRASAAPTPGDTTPQHPTWETNGSVTSCEEYAFEDSYDYSRFEEAADTCGTDYACIYNVAVLPGTPGIAKTTLLKKNGLPMADQIRPQSTGGKGGHTFFLPRPKNPFFAYDLAFLKKIAAYTSNAAFKAKADAIIANAAAAQSYWVSDELAWQIKMHDDLAALGISPAETKSIDQRRESYEQTVARAKRLEQAVADIQDRISNLSWFTQFEKPILDMQLNSANAALSDAYQDLGVALFAEWDHKSIGDGVAIDHGCLSTSSKRCDWTPKIFARTFTGRFQAHREKAFSTCIDATGNNFANVPAASKVDSDAVAAYVAKEILPKYPGDPLSVGQHTGDEADFGSHGSFGFDYDYDAGWKLTAERKPSTGEICRLKGNATASAHATGWIFDHSVSFLDAETSLHVREDAGNLYVFKSHFRVLGNDLYQPISDTQSDDIMKPIDRNVDKVLLAPSFEHTFGLLGYGVNVGVQGELRGGLNVHAEANAPKGCDPSNLAYDVQASARPFLRATAKPYAEIDAYVLKAGVEGTVLLAEIGVPVSARARLTGQQNSISLDLESKADFTLDALDGSIDLYGQLCAPVVGCTDRATKTIYEWDGVHYDFPIWDFQYTLPLLTFDQATKPTMVVVTGPLITRN
jgi:hypothetical protein